MRSCLRGCAGAAERVWLSAPRVWVCYASRWLHAPAPTLLSNCLLAPLINPFNACLPHVPCCIISQNISVTPAPRSQPHRLPTLCHLHLKSCAVPDIGTFSVASSLEWLSLDNCDVAMYVPDLVDLWPSLSWLEITYTHQVRCLKDENFYTCRQIFLVCQGTWGEGRC